MSLKVGAFDNDFYSGEKSKFEGYHTSLALDDDEGVDDETPLIGGGGQKRASYTAPKAVLNENRRMAEESEEDPFKEHVRPTIADREDEYRLVHDENWSNLIEVETITYQESIA